MPLKGFGVLLIFVIGCIERNFKCSSHSVRHFCFTASRIKRFSHSNPLLFLDIAAEVVREAEWQGDGFQVKYHICIGTRGGEAGSSVGNNEEE